MRCLECREEFDPVNELFDRVVCDPCADKIVAVIRRQTRQLIDTGEVTCVCGTHVGKPYLYAWRCFFCGKWFCHRCAGEHFERSEKVRGS